MEYALTHWRLIAALLIAFILVLSYRLVLWLFGVIIVPDDSVGVMTKKPATKRTRCPPVCIWACGLGNTESTWSSSSRCPPAKSGASRPATVSRWLS
jgi:hypothetical protein